MEQVFLLLAWLQELRSTQVFGPGKNQRAIAKASRPNFPKEYKSTNRS
ncbi:hypothetical protein AciX8_3779 [Granulicella mallensis MP5ACTX8]|uniref:Uncharacterized protein n=1 Tax=Granulicella mallensis (strain ATCC BAA-1857 / DSM 23137 / MP5ACTX8) TaxID=682795 RepID=G8P0H5_GRAMM|nr:hypothetical protein AciX8_3779 [Granulicella mallensis MP5ACTX8]